jgi:hypothetical protein
MAVFGLAGTSCGLGGSGSPVRVEVVSGNNGLGPTGQVLPDPIRVRVVDDGGNGVGGVFLRFQVHNVGARIAKAQSGVFGTTVSHMTDALGEAEVWWQLGPDLGPQSMGATVVDELDRPIAGVASALISGEAVLGPPAHLNIVRGDGGSAATGDDADPFVVAVLDISNNPIADVDVSWSVLMGDGAISASTTPTDSNGIATVTHTVGATPGDNVVQASVTGLPPVQFSTIGLIPTPDASGDEVPGTPGYIPPDLVAYGAAVVGNLLVIHLRFAGDAPSDGQGSSRSVVGFIEIDADQDPNTGIHGFIDNLRPDAGATGMGVDYVIPLSVGSSGITTVYREPGRNTAGALIPAFTGKTVTLRIPLSMLQDDGNVDYAVLVGTPKSSLGVFGGTEPTDLAPDDGSASAGPALTPGWAPATRSAWRAAPCGRTARQTPCGRTLP